MLQGGFSLHWRKCSCLQHLVELLVNYGIQYYWLDFLHTRLHSRACSSMVRAVVWCACCLDSSWPPSLREVVTNSLPQGIATHPALGLLHFKPNPPSAFCPPPGTHNPTPNPPPKQKSNKKKKTPCNARNFV